MARRLPTVALLLFVSPLFACNSGQALSTGRNQAPLLVGGALPTTPDEEPLAASSFAVGAPLPSAVLNPGTIHGTVQVGNEVVSYGNAHALNEDGSASISLSGSNYELTVNVPEGSTSDYRVRATAGFASGVFFMFPWQTVTVAENPAATQADFIVAIPGVVQGTVTVLGGGALSSAGVWAGEYPSQIRSSTSVGDGSFQLLVAPDTHLVVGGWANINGQDVSFTPQVISISAGEIATVNFTVDTPPPPPELGQITGTIQMPGPQVPTGHSLLLSGPESYSVWTADGNFNLSEVSPGYYRVSSYSAFSNPSRYFTHPYASISPTEVVVYPGGTATVNVSSPQAFMAGTVSVQGTTSLGEASEHRFAVYGEGDTRGAEASADIDATTGAYELVVSPGHWSASLLVLSWANDLPPAQYLNGYLNLYDTRLDVTVAAGETATYHPPAYQFGEVTIRFSVSGGGALSYPVLRGNCEHRDSSQETLWRYSFYAKSAQSNVTQGLVNFHAVAGDCRVSANAIVNGSYTTFSDFNVTVVPGVHQVIDMGGPSLGVQLPAPDSSTVLNEVTVTGRATDDEGIASVTVNGVLATLSPTNNPTDPAEVAFTATVPLPSAGANTLITVATDLSGKTSVDTRTVYKDAYPPTLVWTPADNTSSHVAHIQVQGTATDDRGIAAITVDGQAVTFQSTGNAADPNEVSFVKPLTLSPGVNLITVVATDLGQRITSQTHQVALQDSDSTPPATQITLTGTRGDNNWFTSSVGITLQATDNPGGSGVSITEYSLDGGPFVAYAGGLTVTGQGEHQIVYRSRDHAGNVEANQTGLFKIDRTPPSLECSVNPTHLWPPNHRMHPVEVSAMVTDSTSGAGLLTLLSATSSEPDNGTGDGDFPGDIQGFEAGTAATIGALRAERAGGGQKRRYSLVYKATDQAGNAAQCEVAVEVAHDRGGD